MSMAFSRLSEKEEDDSPRTGPRGGTTTVTSTGMIRKNLWISHEENEALRRRAFDERRSETQIIRAGLRQILGLRAEED
jgi:hypothetical protein